LFLGLLVCPRAAKAEKVIAKQDDWEVFTDGRAGAFLSYVQGDARPPATKGKDPSGNEVTLHDVSGGGWDPDYDSGDPTGQKQGTVQTMRIRTGYIGNLLGFGVRNRVSDTIKASAYIQLWSYVESDGRQKGKLSQVDVRQGYARLEAPWGTFTAGRQRGLFSRGATDIDTMYADRWGVGFFGGGGAIDSAPFGGPTAGHIGFGVLGSGFAAGLVYATPVLAGFQLTAGLYDPTQEQGPNYLRTKWARPEGELTFEHAIGTIGKVVLFGNGAYQQVYTRGYCDSTTRGGGPCSPTAKGFGYGGRLEVGFFHLGLAGHYGTGLGINYALEVSDAATDPAGNFRTFDGYYAQTQWVLGPVDVQAGIGITRVFLTDQDKKTVPDPTDPTMMNQIYQHSVIKDQIGASLGAVYHYRPFLHFDLDFFRAQADWFLGEKQVLYATNAGMTFSW
jgi:hypothetical protein